MNKIKVLAAFLILGLCLNGCSLKSVKEWASNKLEIEVYNSQGKPIEKASVESSEKQRIETNKSGKAVLYYQKSGLKVITISADQYETKQIKANMPKDNKRVVSVMLVEKN